MNVGIIIAYNISKYKKRMEELKMTNLEIFNKAIKDTFDTKEITKIEDSFGPDEIEDWDSLSHIELITLLEEKFDISLAVQDVSRMYTIGDIKKILKKYSVII